jgi:hypothetical protein
MQTQSISTYAAIAAALALLAAILWYVLSRRFRMASTREELLDLLEGSYSVPEDQASPTPPNHESPDQNRAARVRAADPGRLPPSAYGKARVERYSERGQSLPDDIRAGAASDRQKWIAVYEPMVHRARFNRDN